MAKNAKNTHIWTQKSPFKWLFFQKIRIFLKKIWLFQNNFLNLLNKAKSYEKDKNQIP